MIAPSIRAHEFKTERLLNNSSKFANPGVRRDPETCQRNVAGQGEYFPKLPGTQNKNCLETSNLTVIYNPRFQSEVRHPALIAVRA